MIVMDIKHIDHQVLMTTALKKAIDFLRRPYIHNLADGRVDIDGQDVFALVQRYETVNPVRELCSLTTKNGGIEPPSLMNDLYHRQESVAFSNGVKTDTPKFEYHRKYIDIQYIVSGKEVIGWAPVERMTITEAYDMEKDICFGTVPKEEITPVYLQAGQLAVLYPEDGHAPKLAAGKPSHVVKIVVKVAAKLSKT